MADWQVSTCGIRFCPKATLPLSTQIAAYLMVLLLTGVYSKILLMAMLQLKSLREKNPGALENIYSGRQTGAKQEAKRLKKENKILINEKISCLVHRVQFFSFLLPIVSETLTCFCKQKISHFNSLSLFFLHQSIMTAAGPEGKQRCKIG